MLLQLAGWVSLAVAVCIAFVILRRRYWQFQDRFAALSAQVDRYLGQMEEDTDRLASPGHLFVVASQGPTNSKEAELQSVEARWRHVSIAFPQLAAHTIERSKLLLASVPYTNLDAVARMQTGLVGSINTRFRDAVSAPEWIQTLGKDFDALRHPQLAIATPIIYTFPFLLSWQRRHQWGVLPYATHTRLGVFVRSHHPNFLQLCNIEAAYNSALLEKETTPLWLNEMEYAKWLPILLNAAGDEPVRIQRGVGQNIREQHLRPTVFSVGAYLHKELLPLACAVLADIRVAESFVKNVEELQVSEYFELLPENDTTPWPNASAIIVDLAVAEEPDPSSGWRLLRLPHSVYTPIGIGFSVLALPLLVSDVTTRRWWNDRLADAGENLLPAKVELSKIGIELDERLWVGNYLHGR
jgi:hypothetical protein